MKHHRQGYRVSQYLDIDRLESIDASDFRARSPYPWANPDNLLTEEGYRLLLENMPDVSQFTREFGKERRGKQAPHDRYSLEYTEGMDVPEPWQDFIDELRGDRYRAAIGRLFDAKNPEFRFHWHYAPPSCSVSPHCDAKREFGAHIWYFNSEEEWDPEWGGNAETQKFMLPPTLQFLMAFSHLSRFITKKATVIAVSDVKASLHMILPKLKRRLP